MEVNSHDRFHSGLRNNHSTGICFFVSPGALVFVLTALAQPLDPVKKAATFVGLYSLVFTVICLTGLLLGKFRKFLRSIHYWKHSGHILGCWALDRRIEKCAQTRQVKSNGIRHLRANSCIVTRLWSNHDNDIISRSFCEQRYRNSRTAVHYISCPHSFW